MCLVEVGMPMRDRASGEPLLEEDGSPKLNFGPGLQTGCTVTVQDGMVVRTTTPQVQAARHDIVEFLLTSHPLDCPICDKGGECPLQELTMRHGAGASRMDFLDKKKLDKHVPLGELIYLDRERCIQCARCIRFQDEIVDDPVISFHNRGRALEIVTMSEPGFDSIWSGNTTDICPVGALTTSDFRFGARPWEMTPVASICTHCPVGCNIGFSTRRAAKSGMNAIKRILPRQNEEVNEIWLCDKGRFAHHFASSPERLKSPMIRRGGQLVEASWDEALEFAAAGLRKHASQVAGLASGRLSNEDLYLFQKLFRFGLGSYDIDLIDRPMGGGDTVAHVGLTSGSNLKDLGQGDTIVVMASDLHEESPLWWLRVKQAAERGASLIVANLRTTRLDKHATVSLRYAPGKILQAALHLSDNVAQPESDEAQATTLIASARNLVIFYGSEGLDQVQSGALARILGNLFLSTTAGDQSENRAGRINNGLIPVWPKANTQGAWDMGVRPEFGAGYLPLEEPGKNARAILDSAADGSLGALYLLAADPIGDGHLQDRSKIQFMVVQELFMTKTAKKADVVFPAQSWAERDGTFTSGERRVQRFYPAISPVGNSLPDWTILARLGAHFGLDDIPRAASLLFGEIASKVRHYRGLDYRSLAAVKKQWPLLGSDEFYYGGNVIENSAGMGVQWSTLAESESVGQLYVSPVDHGPTGELLLLETITLYRDSALLNHSPILANRVISSTAVLHPADAAKLRAVDGDMVLLSVGERYVAARVESGDAPEGIVLLKGQKLNIPLSTVAVKSLAVAE